MACGVPSIFGNCHVVEQPLEHTLAPTRFRPSLFNVSIVGTRTGKTMKYGRARSIMCLEDLEVILCPLFSLALLLFWRFDVLKEEVPDFTDRTKWYRERVFTFADGGEYTAKDQYAAVKRLHKEHGVGGHVVHAARVSAAQGDARNRWACQRGALNKDDHPSSRIIPSRVYSSRPRVMLCSIAPPEFLLVRLRRQRT